MNDDALFGELRALHELMSAYPASDLAQSPGLEVMFQSLKKREQEIVAQLDEVPAPELALTIEGSSVQGHSILVDQLARLLASLQGTLSAIGQSLTDRVTIKGQVPAHIREATALRLIGTVEGSFGVRLRGPILPPVQESLFLEQVGATTVFDSSLEVVLDVVEAVVRDEPEDTVRELLVPLGIRAVHRFAELADVINVSTVDVATFLWRGPEQEEPRRIRLSRQSAEKLEETLTRAEESQRDIPFTGRLVGASLVRDRFELQLDDDEVISGTVERSLVARLKEFFDATCTVTLRVTIAKSTIDEEEAATYRLIDIESPSP